jgi:DNA-binding transcriptional MerR regulator
MYSIKAVSQATGLTVETLRAWERRYGIVVPNRDQTGRRVYRADDVLRLRRLREATERGHPIGRLAELSEESLAQLLDDAPDRRSRATSSAFVERILEAAQQYRSAECEQALTLAIAMLPPQRLVSDVLQPLLREVGERWHRGEFAISQERLVFATLPGERHELGLLMSAMICASRGFKAHYLGPDLPEVEIARYAQEVGASIIALSVVLHEQLAQLPQQLASLAQAMAPESAIWLGGLAPDALPADSVPEDCVMLRSYAELEQRLDMLAA